LKPTRGGK